MVHFDLLMPTGALPGAIWTAVDVLRELNALARVRSPRSPLPPTGWRVIDPAGRTHPFHAATCIDDHERRINRRAQGEPRVLFVPPLEMHSIPALFRLVRRNADSVERLRRHYDEGGLVGACGTGMWLLAQAGILTDAPLPWLYQSGFAAHFPQVRIEAREPIVATHRIVCAAMPSMAHSLVLHLARFAGLADLAHTGAEKLLPNAERQDLSAAMTVDQVMGQSRDAPLFRVMSWLQANASRPLRLDEAARAAAISERTLNRLFKQHLDTTPLQYLQELRMKRARMWLESTWRSVDEIARDCGYGDTSAFCRTFARATGTSPRRYRDRFTLRGPRALWKIGDGAETPG